MTNVLNVARALAHTGDDVITIAGTAVRSVDDDIVRIVDKGGVSSIFRNPNSPVQIKEGVPSLIVTGQGASMIDDLIRSKLPNEMGFMSPNAEDVLLTGRLVQPAASQTPTIVFDAAAGVGTLRTPAAVPTTFEATSATRVLLDYAPAVRA